MKDLHLETMVWKKVAQTFEVCYRSVISLFLAHQKRIAYKLSLLFWITPFLNNVCISYRTKVLSTGFIFAWCGDEFWLGNIENWSSRPETHCWTCEYLLRFANSLRNTAVFLLKGTLECWNFWTTFLSTDVLCPIIHQKLCWESPAELLSERLCWGKELSLKHFLPPKKVSATLLEISIIPFRKDGSLPPILLLSRKWGTFPKGSLSVPLMVSLHFLWLLFGSSCFNHMLSEAWSKENTINFL